MPASEARHGIPMQRIVIDQAVTSLLVRASRYRALAATATDAEIAREFEHLASLFEAQAARGVGHPARLH